MPGLAAPADPMPPRRTRTLVMLALAALAGALVAGPGTARLGLLAIGATLLLTVVLLRAGAAAAAWRTRRLGAQVRAIVAEDAAPCFTTDAEGAVLDRNRAAAARFGAGDAGPLVTALGDFFAHPAAVLYRLQARAARSGAAREDVATRQGLARLSVHRVGPATFLWRLEEMPRRPDAAGPGGDAVGLPMLVASRTGAVLFVNEAMRRLVGGRPRRLDRIFTDPEVRPGEPAVVAGADGPVRVLVAEVAGPGERREIYLVPAPPETPRAAPVGEDDLPVALVRLGPGGAIAAANRRAREMLGLGAAAATLPERLDGPGRPLTDWLADLAAGRLPPRPEVMRLRRSAEDRFVQVVPWRAPDGTLTAVLTDATALKTLEAQYAQGHKMQAIGQLAGGIAHDFNNLLTAISGHCDLLLLRREAADPDFADLVQIRQNANRAAALVSQLLAFSRKQPMLPERLDLGEVLGDVTHLLRRLVGAKVTLDLVPSADPGPVRADRRQIEQVLINLVVNARDAMPDGGPIRIATARRRLFMPLTRGRATVPPGDYVLITVADRGCGIPQDVQEKIFEPFFTTKRAGEGTGLGLATVYGIVKQNGGFIFVDSEPGRGSTFTIWLPRVDDGCPEIPALDDSPCVVPQILLQPRVAAPGSPPFPAEDAEEGGPAAAPLEPGPGADGGGAEPAEDGPGDAPEAGRRPVAVPCAPPGPTTAKMAQATEPEALPFPAPAGPGLPPPDPARAGRAKRTRRRSRPCPPTIRPPGWRGRRPRPAGQAS